MSLRLVSVAGRMPPHDLDAEAAVLSTGLLTPAALDVIVPLLHREDFYSESNAKIWDAVVALYDAAEPIDSVQVAGWLRDRDRLAAVGGAAYIAKIVDATPATANVERHAARVAQLARARRHISEAQLTAAQGYGDLGDLDEWCEGVEARHARVNDARRADSGPVDVGSAITDAFAQIQAEADGGSSTALPTGLVDLDRLAKLKRGQLVTIAGASGGGKTSMGLQVATVNALAGNGVLYVSAETPRAQLAKRQVAQHARIDASDPQRWLAADWASATAAASELHGSPMLISDDPEQSITSIRAAVRRARAALRRRATPVELALVVVDYIGLIDASDLGRNATREQQVSHVARGLKRLAMAENVLVVALAQLNGDPESEKRRPALRDLRESKAIGMHSDVVLLVHCPDRDQRDERTQAEGAEVVVAKQRDGAIGVVPAMFLPRCSRFVDVERGR